MMMDDDVDHVQADVQDDVQNDVDHVQAAGAVGLTIAEAASPSPPSGFPRIAPE